MLTNTKVIEMQQDNRTITQIVFCLGLSLLALCCVLLLFIHLLPISQTARQDFTLPRFGLLFGMLPISSFLKKIKGLFTRKEALDKPAEIDAKPCAKALITLENKKQVTGLLLTLVRQMLDPEFINLYRFDPKSAGFRRDGDHQQSTIMPSFVPLNASIAKRLGEMPGIFSSSGVDEEFKPIQAEPRESGQINAYLVVPLHSQQTVLGWLLIGPPKNKKGYDFSDFEEIELLTRIFSEAYQKTAPIDSNHSQAAENEIRNCIMKAINNGKIFDQVLTEIYLQIQEILTINELSLILQNLETPGYKRLFEIQNHRPKITTDAPEALNAEFLEKDVIASGEIQIIETNGSWLIIPLRTNQEIIGALSIHAQQSKTVFESMDVNFFHFLAEALTHAAKIYHLKQVNQRQKQQLEIFNKVSEQLTSIDHLEPLLVNILDAAMNILNCSSGVLMVIDESQNELVFEVAAGPVGSGLQGERLPSNAGIAGQAYQSQKPIIANHVDQDSLWFQKDYPRAVAKIENMMAVPLTAHGHIIGILELINKQNKMPFNESDQKILESFANQAAIALYNASLYSETDQALEARLEELSMMQQIDQDLNATQDINRAMQQLLQAALKHTSARSGTIGLVDQNAEMIENIWQIRPGEGIPTMLQDLHLPGKSWFSEEFFKLQILQSAELSESLRLSEAEQWHYFIISELEDNRLLLLLIHTKSAEQLTGHDRAFLTRLKDHAIIALNNTLLYEELHHVIQDKNEFIGFISHELKNPLTVIKGYADILRKGMAGNVNEEQIDYLTTINHNVNRMNTFIKDLSDQSHIESQSLRLDFESTSVSEVIHEVLQSYKAQIEKKSLQVEMNIPKNIPNVWCDRLRLIQILANLISNAIKYSPANSEIKIGASHSANIWDEKGAAEVVHFWVEDKGYGISIEDQAHLFQKFYRGSDVRIKKTPGTGLGLRISKSLVEMMGGKMWFASTLNEGSTFSFTLPI